MRIAVGNVFWTSRKCEHEYCAFPIIIIVILFIYFMLFLQMQGAHSLLQAHCCKLCTETLLQKHWLQHIVANTLLQSQNIDITLQKKIHSSNNTADKGLMNTNNNGSIQAVDETEKVSFSSGSESTDTIRRADLLRKSVPSRRGGVCEISLTIGYGTDRWTTEDRVVRTWAKLTGSGVNSKKVREVGRRVSWQRVVANTCKFVLDAIINW